MGLAQVRPVLRCTGHRSLFRSIMGRFRRGRFSIMTSFKLPFVHVFRDRLGKLRRYLRRPGVPRVRLPGLPGSPEFMHAYNGALEGKGKVALPSSRYGEGSIGALWTAYCRSASHINLSDSSKRNYRQIMSPILEQHGHRSVTGMNRQYARQIVESVGLNAPSMANLTIAVMRLLFSFARLAARQSLPRTPEIQRRRTRVLV